MALAPGRWGPPHAAVRWPLRCGCSHSLSDSHSLTHSVMHSVCALHSPTSFLALVQDNTCIRSKHTFSATRSSLATHHTFSDTEQVNSLGSFEVWSDVALGRGSTCSENQTSNFFSQCHLCYTERAPLWALSPSPARLNSCPGFRVRVRQGGVSRTRSLCAAVVAKAGSDGARGEEGSMGYWLMKTEPGEWGWEHQERNGGLSLWDGVRNAQAQGHLRSMQLGDHAFFYHSGKGPAVVGVVEVVRAAYPDSTDESGKHSMVDVRALAALPTPVPLSIIRGDEAMRDWVLLRQSRLSVMPVSPAVWARVCELGEFSPPLCLTANEDDGAVSEIKETETKETQPKRTKKKKPETRVKDSSETEDELKARARRLPAKRKNGVSGAVQEGVKQEEQSTESEVVCIAELKTYQRVSRRKVDIVEVAVIASKVSKRQTSRGVKKLS